MACSTHPGMKRLFDLKDKNGLGRFAPSALPYYNPINMVWITTYLYLPQQPLLLLPQQLLQRSKLGIICRCSLPAQAIHRVLHVFFSSFSVKINSGGEARRQFWG